MAYMEEEYDYSCEASEALGHSIGREKHVEGQAIGRFC
jgi:hypothetical protein